MFGRAERETSPSSARRSSPTKARAFYHVPLVIEGSETVNNIRTLPIYDEQALIGSIILIEDLTEFDKLRKQVILSEKLASVGLLAAGVAHEINNPLEIIYNYLKYIKVSFEDAKLRRRWMTCTRRSRISPAS